MRTISSVWSACGLSPQLRTFTEAVHVASMLEIYYRVSSCFQTTHVNMAFLGAGIDESTNNLSNQLICKEDLCNIQFGMYIRREQNNVAQRADESSYHRVGSQKEALLWMAKSWRVVQLSWQIQFSAALLPSCTW